MARGRVFVTTSDTEVLLAALQEWDVTALPRLEGMFAFAWYDVRSKRLVLARDRFGIKPLHIHRQRDMFAFSSEIKPLLLHPRIPRAVNQRVISEYFAYQTIAPPATSFEGIEVFALVCF